MKIHVRIFDHSRHRQNGTAVIVVLTLLALVLIYVLANLRTLYSLSRELNLLDKRQTRRLEAFSRTNLASNAHSNNVIQIEH